MSSSSPEVQMLSLLVVGCTVAPAPLPSPGPDLSPLQGAWPRVARRGGVCTGQCGFEVIREDSPTGFGLVDRTRRPQREFHIVDATMSGPYSVRLSVQRDDRPVRLLDIALDSAGRATITWIDPPRPSFVLMTPMGARSRPITPCPL
jgi:hypothetical protein